MVVDQRSSSSRLNTLCRVGTVPCRADPMKGLDVMAFIRFYVEGNAHGRDDPFKDYETVKEAIKLEEETKATIAAQIEQMANMKGDSKESKKEEMRRRRELQKRNKVATKAPRK